VGAFDIIGPVMVGPSSSHTAGAARIGYMARALLGEEVAEARILLHGSFAATGRGHGTDRALVGGLLGYAPSDPRLRTSLEEAARQGVRVHMEDQDLGEVHPNTVRLLLTGRAGGHADVLASSVGGGRAEVWEVDGFSVRFDLGRPTLLVFHRDQPGAVADVTAILARAQVNIAAMQVSRQRRGGRALMVMECDDPVAPATCRQVASLPEVERVRYVELA
jgi:L-serine dehydratase